jgi:hypothetical protein
MNRFAIYASDGTLLRWIVSDTLTVDKVGLQSGEAVIQIPDASYGDRFAIQAFVSAQTNLFPVQAVPVGPIIPPATPAQIAAKEAQLATLNAAALQ